MKQFIKKNKLPIMMIILFIILLLIGVQIYRTLMPDSNSAIYGNRLEDKVDINKATYEEIVTNLNNEEVINSARIEEQGLIINVFIQVKDETTTSKARELSSIVVKGLSEEQLSSHDIQVIITSENEELNSYPLIGYKNKIKTNFSWLKERSETE